MRNKNYDALLTRNLTKEQRKRLFDEGLAMVDRVSNLVREKNPDRGSACLCSCHIKGITVRHIVACCEFCYKPFINQDGSVDKKLLLKYVKGELKAIENNDIGRNRKCVGKRQQNRSDRIDKRKPVNS